MYYELEIANLALSAKTQVETRNRINTANFPFRNCPVIFLSNFNDKISTNITSSYASAYRILHSDCGLRELDFSEVKFSFEIYVVEDGKEDSVFAQNNLPHGQTRGEGRNKHQRVNGEVCRKLKT